MREQKEKNDRMVRLLNQAEGALRQCNKVTIYLLSSPLP